MRDVAGGRAVGVAWPKAELDAVVGQDGVDLVGNGGDQSDEEGRGRHPVGAVDPLHEGELAGPVDGDEQMELALRRLKLGDVDVEEADRIGLELLLRLPVALDRRQPADAMALKAAMQR